MYNKLPVRQKKVMFVPMVIVMSSFFFANNASANSSTSININTQSGSNTVNGVTTKTTGTTKIIINGKEIVNDDSGGSHDIVDDSNGGRVEVHVNSNKATTTNPATLPQTNVTVTPAPTVDIEPTIAKKRQEVLQMATKMRKEQEEKKKSLVDQLQQTLETMFTGLSFILRSIGGK